MNLTAVPSPVEQKPFVLPEPPGAPWTLESSYAYTIETAKAEPENDTLAYRFLGDTLRPHIATIYTFARLAFDFGAEPKWEGKRHEALDAFEHALIECYRGRATHPLFIALRETAERYGVPVSPFQDYITGARMNISLRRYASFQQLLHYCEKAANPIGRAILKIAGSTDPDDVRAADDISTAMMLNSFWANCARDFQRGRIHFPQEDMLRFGVTESDLQQRRMSKEFKALMDFEVTRTRLYLKRGRPVFDRLPRALHMPLQIVWLCTNVGLDNIEADGFDVFTKNHTLRAQDWMKAAARLAVWRVKDFTQW